MTPSPGACGRCWGSRHREHLTSAALLPASGPEQSPEAWTRTVRAEGRKTGARLDETLESENRASPTPARNPCLLDSRLTQLRSPRGHLRLATVLEGPNWGVGPGARRVWRSTEGCQRNSEYGGACGSGDKGTRLNVKTLKMRALCSTNAHRGFSEVP